MGMDQKAEAERRRQLHHGEVANSTCVHSWLDRTGHTVRLVFVDTYQIDAGYTVNGEQAKARVRAHAKIVRDNGDGTWSKKQIGMTAALRLLAEDARRSQQKAAEHRKRSRTVLDALREQGQRRMGSEPKEGD